MGQLVPFLLAALLLSCRNPVPESSDTDSSPDPATDAVPHAESSPQEPMQTPKSDSLALHLDVPDSVASGMPVTIRFRVENVSSRNVDLYLLGREVTFDVIVRSRDGSAVWRRLENQVVPAILRVEPLAPGGTIDLQATWDQQTGSGQLVPAGDYGVEAELLTEDQPLRSSRATLRITAR